MDIIISQIKSQLKYNACLKKNVEKFKMLKKIPFD